MQGGKNRLGMGIYQLFIYGGLVAQWLLPEQLIMLLLFQRQIVQMNGTVKGIL
jgi:hypothetical protein